MKETFRIYNMKKIIKSTLFLYNRYEKEKFNFFWFFIIYCNWKYHFRLDMVEQMKHCVNSKQIKQLLTFAQHNNHLNHRVKIIIIINVTREKDANISGLLK